MSKKMKLGEICNILNGYAFKSKEYVDDGIRVIRITNVQKGFIEDFNPKYYDISQTDKLKNYMLKENDLLISLTGNVGRVGLMSKEFLPAGLNQRVGCLRIKDIENISIEYLYQYLNSNKFEKECINNSNGIAQKNLSTEWLKDYMITVPSIEEQKQIANKLEKVQRISKTKKEQIKELDELIKSQFVEMFGDPNKNEKNFKTEELKNCILNIENGKSFVCENFARKNEYPAILKLSAVTYGNYNQDENKALIKQEMFISKNEVHSGDLLFTRKNTPELVGMSAFVYDTKPNLMLPDIIFRINTLENCNKIYLWQMINHPFFRNKIMAISNGSAKSMSNISKENLMNLKIILPPIELQNQFAEIVKQIDKQKFESVMELKKLQKNIFYKWGR